jgi:large subunit ribosomal protein L9
MKVILIDNLPKLGKIGDTLTVKNGYAKNYLIPNKKAICFTPENYKSFAEKKSQYEQLNKEKLDLANKVKSLVEGKNIIILENASDDGRLYGSVNTSLIANKINDSISEKLIEKSSIFLAKPIKEIGIFSVKVDLHNDVEILVKLVVSRSESEAQALLNPVKKGSKNKDQEKNSSEKNSDSESSSIDSEENEEKKSKLAKKPRKKKTEIES